MKDANMPCRWKAVEGLIRALGELRAESFHLEYEHAEAAVIEEAERAIGLVAIAIGATFGAPEDADRLLGACEAVVAAHARMDALRAMTAAVAAVEEADDLHHRAALLLDAIRGTERVDSSDLARSGTG
jgi:hypothetical protein